MPRKVPEWIGKTADAPIPPRVKLRVYDLYGGKCVLCGQPVIKAEYDHKVALVNGGENRESNFQLLCHRCHGDKTRGDVSEKSKRSRARKKYLGIKEKKAWPLAKRFKRKLDGTVVER